MDIKRWKTQPWPDRLSQVQEAIQAVLRTAPTGPHPTTWVVESVCNSLGVGDSPDAKKAVSKIVLQIADNHPAVRDGGQFQMYGRVCRRKMWAPGDYLLSGTPAVEAAPTPTRRSDTFLGDLDKIRGQVLRLASEIVDGPAFSDQPEDRISDALDQVILAIRSAYVARCEASEKALASSLME